MIVLNSPKGWTGRRWLMACRLKAPSVHRCRSPTRHHPEHLKLLEDWLKLPAGRLFDEQGRRPELAELAQGRTTHGRRSHANGGILLRDLRMPVSATTRSTFPRRGCAALATHVLGRFYGTWRS